MFSGSNTFLLQDGERVDIPAGHHYVPVTKLREAHDRTTPLVTLNRFCSDFRCHTMNEKWISPFILWKKNDPDITFGQDGERVDIPAGHHYVPVTKLKEVHTPTQSDFSVNLATKITTQPLEYY